MEPDRSGGYDPAHFASLVEVEDRHFWFRARNQIVSALARQVTATLAPGYRVLELGCGDGNVLRFLEKACSGGTVVGMELFGEALKLARRRTSCSLVEADISQAPFKPGGFQLIGVFDVLEHISDDETVLRQLWELLEEDGRLLLTVPAHGSLWSYFDELSGHCRRYEAAELRAKLEAASFKIEFLTPYMASLYPLMWLRRKIKSKTLNKTSSSDELLKSEIRVLPVVNAVLATVLSWESRLLARREKLPFGVSFLAVARKRSR